MNYHTGLRIQRGAGIGSLFAGLFRGLMPMAKSAVKGIGKVIKSDAAQAAGKYFKKEATKAAVDTALEAIEGKKVGQAAKHRLKSATKNILLHAAKQADGNNNKNNNNKSSRPKKRRKNIKLLTNKKRKIRNVPLFDNDY